MLNNIDRDKNIKKGLLLVVLFCLVACQSSDQSLSTLSPSDELSRQEIRQLQNGDILLRKGFGFVSNAIARYLDEQYPITHCGLVLKLTDSTAQVLHTLSDSKINGMCLQSLSDYCGQSQKNTLIAVRFRSSQQHIDTILAKAKELLAQKIPFDMGFDDQDASKLYCIEMIRNVIKETVGKDYLNKRTTKGGANVLRMDNLLDTNNFAIVFNHFDTLAFAQ